MLNHIGYGKFQLFRNHKLTVVISNILHSFILHRVSLMGHLAYLVAAKLLMQGNANQTPHKQPQHLATWMTPRCGIDRRQGLWHWFLNSLVPQLPQLTQLPQLPQLTQLTQLPDPAIDPRVWASACASTASICSMCRAMCGCKYNLLHSGAHIPMAHNFIGLPAMRWDAFPWLRWQQTESTVPRWHWHPLRCSVYGL